MFLPYNKAGRVFGAEKGMALAREKGEEGLYTSFTGTFGPDQMRFLLAAVGRRHCSASLLQYSCYSACNYRYSVVSKQ